jgi:hypothetical protein
MPCFLKYLTKVYVASLVACAWSNPLTMYFVGMLVFIVIVGLLYMALLHNHGEKKATPEPKEPPANGPNLRVVSKSL